MLFQSHKSLKKKQLLDELSGRGLTDDVKLVSAILKVHSHTLMIKAFYSHALLYMIC